MKRLCTYLFLVTFVGAVASCAEPKPRTKQVAATSSHFDAIGRVTFHQGQPCASQIMFDFDIGFGQRVWLAAGEKESIVLTNAVQHRQRVRVSGDWRHGKTKDCRYVSVITVSR